MELTHLGIAVIMDDYNEITLSPMDLRFPEASRDTLISCGLPG
jgi:hypothetical protein